MNKSESIVNLAKAIFKFQSSIGNIGKDGVNPFLKNKYATLTNILDNINEHFAAHGLIVMQHPVGESGEIVTLQTILMHGETGEYIESEFSMIPVKKDPQGIGSCITYMRRYALVSVLKLNVDDDDDGNAASGKGKDGGKAGKLNEDFGVTQKSGGNVKNNMTDIPGASYTELLEKIGLSQSVAELNEIIPLIGKNVTDPEQKAALRALFQEKKASLI